MTRRILKKIHLILSIPAGLFISLICFTGALLIFDKEIDLLFYPERFYVSEEFKEKEPLVLDELVKNINAKLDTNTVKSVTVFADKERTYIADLKKGGRAIIYIHPYTGEILHKEVYSETFYFKVLSLHRWLMGKPSGIGQEIVRISTILLLIISITGLILWIPRNRKQMKNRFKISFRKSLRRFIYDLHAVGGMYIFIILMLLSVTGLTISYPSFKKKLENTIMQSKSDVSTQERDNDSDLKAEKRNVEKAPMIGVEKHALAVSNDIEKSADLATDSLSSKKKVAKSTNDMMQKSLNLLETEFSDFEYITIDPTKAWVHLENAPNERAHETVFFNKGTGEIKKKTSYKESNSSARFNGWIYSLHVGSYWGMLSKGLTFAAAIIGGLLPLTGYYLYFRRKSKKRMVNK